MSPLTGFINYLIMDKISLANAHLPQLIGLVLMSIGYTLGNKFYLPRINKSNWQINIIREKTFIYKSNSINWHLCSKNVTKQPGITSFSLILLQYVNFVLHYLIIPKLRMSKIKSVEKEKIVAEKLNGRFAMIGFIAAVGAYLTTGQIIPGFV